MSVDFKDGQFFRHPEETLVKVWEKLKIVLKHLGFVIALATKFLLSPKFSPVFLLLYRNTGNGYKISGLNEMLHRGKKIVKYYF